MGPYYRAIDVAHEPRGFRPDMPPLLFEGVIRHWPALSKWSLAHFAERFPAQRLRLEKFDPHSPVPYLEQTALNEFREVSFGELREGFEAIQPSYAVRENSDLFEHLPELVGDLDGFRPFKASSDGYRSLWIGPKNYVTGMHTDPGPTLVFQIQGAKQVLLFEPSQAANVYAASRRRIRERFATTSLKESLHAEDLRGLVEGTGWADVQPFDPDFGRYPLFGRASGTRCDLRPGDVLYIPDGWWHAVKGLDLTISVAAEPLMEEGA